MSNHLNIILIPWYNRTNIMIKIAAGSKFGIELGSGSLSVPIIFLYQSRTLTGLLPV
jgi:hypothetical protein